MVDNIGELTSPEESGLDQAYMVGKTGLAILSDLMAACGIPVGAMIENLYEILVKPPIKKRVHEWAKKMATVVLELKSRLENLEALINNEFFLTIIIQSYVVAMRNHQKEKLEALKNIIINSAIITDISEDLKLVFVRLIDELTPSHLKLHGFLAQNEKRFFKIKSYSDLYKEYVTYCGIKQEKDEFKMLCQDLIQKGLLQISSSIDDFNDIYETSSLALQGTPSQDAPNLRVTYIGKRFLDFIIEPYN